MEWRIGVEDWSGGLEWRIGGEDWSGVEDWIGVEEWPACLGPGMPGQGH